MRKTCLKKFLLIFLFLFSANICFAAKIPKVEEIYGYFIAAGSGLAILAMIYGGIRFLISAGDPGAIKEAKQWIIAGFSGAIIIGGVGTIYKSITGKFPSFEMGEVPTIKVPEIPKGPGVYFYPAENCKGLETIEEITGIGIKSVEIINGDGKEFAVFVKGTEDECDLFVGSKCHKKFAFPLGSLPRIYQLNKEAETRIIFYRRPYFLGKAYRFCSNIAKAALCSKNFSGIKKDIMLGTLKIQDGDCKCLYQTDPDISCFGSLQIIGPSAVILYNEEGKCEIYESEFLEGTEEGEETKQDNVKIQKVFSKSKPYKATIIPFKR